MAHLVTIMAAAAPGLFRNALQNLLSAYPEVAVILLTSDVAATLHAISVNHPRLVLLDGDMLSRLPNALPDIVTELGNDSGLLVFASDADQYATFRGICNGRAICHVLYKGVHPDEIAAYIVEMLSFSTSGTSDF